MKYDWIEIAMENGGVLTASRNVHGISATMNWRGADPIRGDHHTTLPDALTSLNEALLEDAADECCPPPKPIQYTGEVPCQKCGTTHWMHGPCPENTKGLASPAGSELPKL